MVSRCQHGRRSDGVSAAACLRCAAVVKEISQDLARHQYVPMSFACLPGFVLVCYMPLAYASASIVIERRHQNTPKQGGK